MRTVKRVRKCIETFYGSSITTVNDTKNIQKIYEEIFIFFLKKSENIYEKRKKGTFLRDFLRSSSRFSNIFYSTFSSISSFFKKRKLKSTFPGKLNIVLDLFA